MSKLINRTKEEKKRQGEIIGEVRDILAGKGIFPVLNTGTVLGIFREGDFIDWDWDTEFFLLYEQVKDMQEELQEALTKSGFETKMTRAEKRNWKIKVQKEHWKVELCAWSAEGDRYVRKMNGGKSVYSIPRRYMEDLQTVVFYDHMYFMPSDYEGFLTHLYGDWRKPRKTKKRREYCASAYNFKRKKK